MLQLLIWRDLKISKSKIAPRIIKLGVSLVQMGEKDQGCLMIAELKNSTQMQLNLCFKRLRL